VNEIRPKLDLIKKRLQEEIDSGLNHAREFELAAKCYLYLGETAKAKEHFAQAEVKVAAIAENLKKKHDLHLYGERMLSIANYHRMLGNYTKMNDILREIEPIYESEYINRVKNLPGGDSRFYFDWCTILFHLQRYEKAYEVGNMTRRRPLPPRGYAKGLMLKDKSIIEATLQEVIKDIKDERLMPYENCLNVADNWGWYEIGRQLLGLPSILDQFKEEV
jgi:tetratricopeptide (TPR) repeat protein